ncbi:MAG: CCA tRNA nucleotidyltransferase [Kordiimonadaceae bacterium]|jgi:poly(A) polymerase|nr:CCA tRNA nucleotidyltransferase [Kordiimonadaceae bacterium]
MNMNNFKLNLNEHGWLQDRELQQIMMLLNQNGDNARIVGGAVRNALLNNFNNHNRKITDIDIASKLLPKENTDILEKAGIKVIPTGLKHGTVTAVLNKIFFEITTLRRDISMDGRHAVVEFSKDWTEDAKRRDFTINALYLGLDGTVYDPLGGYADIKASRVVFIGDADKRIREDALRILRFYRFSSDLSISAIDEDGMLATIKHKFLLETLSGERVHYELKKIITSERASHIIPLLAEIGLLQVILPQYQCYNSFIRYVKLENLFTLNNVMGRFFCLVPSEHKTIIEISRKLKLSNKEKNQLISYSKPYKITDLSQKNIRRELYYFGKNIVIHNLIYLNLLNVKTLKYINGYLIPKVPFSGKDLVKEGWLEGRDMGDELKRREKIWVENDFKVN